ncbi:MAG: transglutaminase, partial [Massilia sp.]|nr:transglutaminase [Massilia sp.]
MKPRAPFAALRAWLQNFIVRLPRDKADTLMLLAGAVLVLAPHALHLPLWVTALSLTTLCWRVAITVRGTRLPPTWLLATLALGAVGGIWLTFQTILGRDAGVAMLVLLVAFKMLEMRARRDLYVVIYLCFFLLLTTFFYAQGPGTALLMLAAIVMLFAAQLSFQFTGAVPRLRRRLWLSGRLVLTALPLAALLFVVFPRLQGPLWGMPDDATAGRTGMSNSMAPGNLARLAQSDETAFRVRFVDAAPAPQLRYWRGVVLSDFDGRSWTQSAAGAAVDANRAPAPAHSWQGEAVRHEVTLEPSGQRWLFALDLPDAPPALAGNASMLSAEQELSARMPLDQRIRYAVVSHPQYRLQDDATLADAARWLRLPAGFNPRALAAGLALQAQPNPADRVNGVLRTFRREKFIYTMEPPLLGRDSVDEFLFSTRTGFCEHYSSAFVFLMRAAGVPSRVVTGYQGGEINPIDGVLTVRQSDAHAWAEVWLAGRGWLRVDPTAAVAPNRVLRGAPRRAGAGNPFGIAALDGLMGDGGGRHSLLGQLRFRLAAANNSWNQWVLNYTPERQRGAIDALAAGAANPLSWGGVALLAGLLALLHARRVRRRGDPVDALYSALCLQLARHGMSRASAEGPNDFGRRIDAAAMPAARKQAALDFLRLYVAYKYGAQPAPAGLH